MRKVACSRLNVGKTDWVYIDYDENTCSASSLCHADCGFRKSRREKT